MAKFVTFDDGYGKYNFRAIFPSSTPKKEILKKVSNKMSRWLSNHGLDKDDFDFSLIKEFTTIRSMRDGVFYEPEYGSEWND